MSHIQNDRWYEAVEDWCDEIGADPRHIIEDKKGKYVMMLEEFGTPLEEGYDFKPKKHYLPDNLQDHE